MLIITEYDYENNYRKLNNDEMIFHNALKYVLKGEKRFHVEDGKFDLVYKDNDHKAKKDPMFPDSEFYHSEMFFPPYYYYDENDTSKLNLEPFEDFDEIFFEEVNEYSIVVAKLALKHSNLKVHFQEHSFVLFPWLEGVSYKNKPESERVIYVQRSFYPRYVARDRFCTTGLFHCIFTLQWLTDLPIEKIKYLSFSIRKTEGIGSVMTTYSKVTAALKKFNIKVFIESGSTRFTDELLTKYFDFGKVPEDANQDNTIYANSFNALVLNHFVEEHETKIDLNMLQKSFVQQMDEYANVIIGDKKVLGVILRGTDYILANFAGSYHPASLGDCFAIIDDRVKKYNYDKIFLATEDTNFLEKMINKFPNMVIAVSQERHKVEEFTNEKYISQLEKRLYSKDNYYASIEDTTVNYFYAMYMLSRCESLISNCMCSAVNIVNSFNGNKFSRCEIVSDLLDKN